METASPMRVLMILRPDASAHLGGDTFQARNTAAALRVLGLQVDIAETRNPDPRGYDVAHVFGISETDVCQQQIDACVNAKTRIALSPIWISRAEFFARSIACERVLARARNADDACQALAGLASRPANGLASWRTKLRTQRTQRAQAQLLEAADLLLPASANEAREYALHLGIRNKPFVVVPIGVSLERIPQWKPERSGIVCAGRIESMKNQAITALALRDQPFDVTFVGETYDYYGELCKRWASPRMRFLDVVPQPDLFALFAGAEVHCMPSWGETAGMAALEAALCGAKIVAGDRGSEMEYLGGDAEYADPADPESVLAAVKRALARPAREPGDSLDLRVRRLTWERSAQQTLAGYQLVLGARLTRV